MARAQDTKTSVTLLGRLRQESPDASAWHEFVSRYRSKIYVWCARWGLQEADAQDVTQIVLTKLSQTMRTFTYDPTRSFHGWLKTVTHHAWRNYLDAQHRPGVGSGDSQVLEMLHTIEARDDLLQELRDEFRRDVLEEAMERVRLRASPKAWRAFFLLAIEKRPGAEVAAELGMKYSAVFMAKSRVQAMIRGEFTKLDGPEPD